MSKTYNLICVMGATAGGKTSFAVSLAEHLNSEIISADSRQVYKHMDIGTGKDIDEYFINGKKIPYHLINILEAGEKYNVFRYQQDFVDVYQKLRNEGKVPVLCGGTGMYIEAVLKGYKLIRVPTDEKFKSELQNKSTEELVMLLKQHKRLHNVSDISNRKRLIRAVEIAIYYSQHNDIDFDYPDINSLNLQVVFDRDIRRKRISERLRQRLSAGMIDEVEGLLKKGIPSETLIYYGLEYKYITEYLLQKMNYKDMVDNLEIAIHQFSKRQMTWFRKMERAGIKIHKIDGLLPNDEKVKIAANLLTENKNN